MELEKGQKLWIVHGLKYNEGFDYLNVREGEVRHVLNEEQFTSCEGEVYTLHKGAFPEEREAYQRAVEVQSRRIVYLAEHYPGHVNNWYDLILNVSHPDETMKPGWESLNFAAWEFLCPCCKLEYMNQHFIMRLQLSRAIAGIPFVIGSGWRCFDRNKAVGGVDESSHLTGYAADIIAVTSQEKFIVISALLRAGFKRIGVARYYVHVDNDLSKPDQVLWTYKREAA